MAFIVAAISEGSLQERRVPITPETCRKLRSVGAMVLLQAGIGDRAHFPDAAYEGADFDVDADAVLRRADLLLCVQLPTAERLASLNEGAIVVGLLAAGADPAREAQLVARKATSFPLERLPRTTRAQAMDVLSSQAGMAGYKAMLIAAQVAPKFFPMLTTAAGTIRPSKVLVIGAGVAGLQAIATARRLGAQVEGFDVRPETREQIESLGAKFLDLGVSAKGEGGYARELTAEERAMQQQRLADHLKGMDVIVTTAAVPGRPAPKIVSAAMVGGMKPGSVIVDLAAESGGNCELTRAGETVESNGVSVVGPTNLASQGAMHASEMYARNLFNFSQLLIKDAALKLDWDDELIAKTCHLHDGAARAG
jgi:NAD(P) transhydrogenase subunit alpha